MTKAHWLVATVAAVTVFFVAVGGLSIPVAVAGFIILVVAIVLAGETRSSPASEKTPSHAPSEKIEAPSLQAVLDALPDPVVALDPAGLVIASNAAALAIVPALQPQQSALLVLRVPALVEAIRRAIASGEAQHIEFWERVPLERQHEVHVIPAQLPSGLSKSGLLLLTFHDLTSRRRVEQMRADFVANASHELRTPLAALSGFIDTLQGPARDDPAARARFLDIMRAQSSRMGRLIDDLLSLSRIELSQHIRPATPTDIVAILRQVVDALQMLAHEREVEVAMTAPSEPLLVRGDRDELIRVFENLIENALKYGASGKRVEIELKAVREPETGPAVAKISIRDYGVGIPPEHVPRLTERFYRVDVGQSRAEGGTGLGLALVKHILSRHGGRLSIKSMVGAGSTFTVYLPLISDAGGSG